MYLESITLLKELNIISITTRILLALLLGGLLGIEREQKQRPAGFRTYIIVCLGATLAGITNIYIQQFLGGGDPARLPAQVISGIGFLGAGTILVTRTNHIKGLTTAAGLWCSATIGIAVGCGFYTGAIICSIVIVFSLRILTMVDKHFDKYNRYINIYTEFSDSHFTSKLFDYCDRNKYELYDLDFFPSRTPKSGSDQLTYTATFTIKVPNAAMRRNVVSELQQFKEISLIRELK